MKHIITLSFFVGAFALPALASAVTAEESLIIQGRSIPENSIAVTAPATSLESSQTIKTTPPPAPSPSPAGDPDFDLLKTTPPPPPPSPSPSGDPDFDLLRVAAPSPVSVGDVNRDGVLDVVTTKVPPPSPSPSTGLTGSDSGVGELKAKTVPTVSNEGRDRAKGTSDASAGAGSAGADRTIVGDPDFDLLNISVGGNDLEKFRSEVSSTDTTKKVIVRGWDPEKKEEIVGRPEEVKTSEDLKVYVEAVALSDDAIKDIRIKKDVIEVESRESGKLFGFIPVHMTRTVAVKFNLQDSSEDTVDVEFSWWHVFVKKSESAADTKQAITTELNLLKMEDMKRVRSESAMSAYATTLRTVSSVMKTRHDTVKNSISNVR